jgi:phosphoglycolate phosphatase
MSGPISPPKACVFDLDGTLIDSLADIAGALNRCLGLLGLPGHPIERYRYMVGEGVPKLCERAVGKTHPHMVARLAELARPAYRAQLIGQTKPYAGVNNLVAALRDADVPLAVLSNKPHDLSVRIVRHFWPDGDFASVYGYLEEGHRKPSPKYLLRICDELGVSAAQTWMIGDTPTDMETARAAGAVGVGVTWGFRPRDDLAAAGASQLVDSPAALARLAGLSG